MFHQQGGIPITRISVLDDDLSVLSLVEKIISSRPGKEYFVSSYSTVQLLKNDPAGMRADIFIMDISLKDGDGIDVARELQALNDNAKLIYLTGDSANSARIFSTRPSYFLIKPVCSDKLFEALDRAEDSILADKDRIITLYTASYPIRLYRDSVKFVESRGRKLIIHKEDGELELYCRLDSAAASFGSTFCRCHKSFLVNMFYIKAIEGDIISLITGEAIPVSRSNRSSVKSDFALFLGGKL